MSKWRVGRVARALTWNWRVPHLSRRVTGGVFDFDFVSL